VEEGLEGDEGGKGDPSPWLVRAAWAGKRKRVGESAKEKRGKGKPGPAWILAVAGATDFSSALLLLAPQAAAAFLPTHRGGAGASAAPLIWYALAMCVLRSVLVLVVGGVGAGNVGAVLASHLVSLHEHGEREERLKEVVAVVPGQQ
jgi:hypothetical protein